MFSIQAWTNLVIVWRSNNSIQLIISIKLYGGGRSVVWFEKFIVNSMCDQQHDDTARTRFMNTNVFVF